jgi:hypothetical protein
MKGLGFAVPESSVKINKSANTAGSIASVKFEDAKTGKLIVEKFEGAVGIAEKDQL